MWTSNVDVDMRNLIGLITNEGVGEVGASVSVYGLSAATRNCPETATKLPAGGHENCPLTVMGSARHDVVCLATVRG